MNMEMKVVITRSKLTSTKIKRLSSYYKPTMMKLIRMIAIQIISAISVLPALNSSFMAHNMGNRIALSIRTKRYFFRETIKLLKMSIKYLLS